MLNTFNYIQTLRHVKMEIKKELDIKFLFLLSINNLTKLNIILIFLLIKYSLPFYVFKFNSRNNLVYFTFSDLFYNKIWFKYFLKNKYLKKKIKKIKTLFFLPNLKLFQNYRKANYTINYFNFKYNKFINKFYLIFK